MKLRLHNSRLVLILIGVCLGFVAQLVLGLPASEPKPPLTIERPIDVEASLDIPLIELESAPKSEGPGHNDNPGGQQSGLVPPIAIPGMFSALSHQVTNATFVEGSDFSHDPNALFEPHGEKVCASGCAASRHPTEKLTEKHYRELLSEVTIESMDRTNNALEALMYFGPQTRKFMETKGTGALDQDRAEFIWNELLVTHAKLSIRVTDENGKVRTWLEETKVPFDRRHVFEMHTDGVQSLVTSGTVKRVGLDHIWVRL